MDIMQIVVIATQVNVEGIKNGQVKSGKAKKAPETTTKE